MDLFKHKLTKLQCEIFSLLCIKAGEQLNKSEIAKALRVSPTAVGKAIPLLEKLRLVIVRQEGRVKLSKVSLNRDYKRVIELKRVENLRLLYESGLTDYLEQELAGGTVILFGSYSRGEDVINSDIDLAVIGRKDKLLHLENYERLLGRRVNVNIYKSLSGVHEQLRNNLLNGIVIQGSVEL